MATATLTAAGRSVSAPDRPEGAGRWGLLEWFVVVQTMSGGLLYLPGAQAARAPIRALPYLASLALFVALVRPVPRLVRGFPGRGLLSVALVVTALGLLHPDANPTAGLAQTVVQVGITAAAYWVDRFRITPARLDRLIMLMFATNAIGAGVGVLQVLDPGTFLPSEFSAGLGESKVESLTYIGADGKEIIRPCGLTDLPGGASGSGAVAAVFGLLLAVRPRTPIPTRAILIAAAGVGVMAVYLTQVRSILMTGVVTTGLACYLLVRQGRAGEAVGLMWAGAAVIVGAFVLAVGIGGTSVRDRFLGLIETGAVESYKENRGMFLEYTLFEAPTEFPLGAGAGRWGTMEASFARFDPARSSPLWAEIQPTGWIYDGGIPLLVTYVGAIVVTCWAVYQMAVRPRSPLAYPAALVLASNLFVVAQSFAGPAFNYVTGTQFWFYSAALFAAAKQASARGARREPAPW